MFCIQQVHVIISSSHNWCIVYFNDVEFSKEKNENELEKQKK